MQPGHMDRFGVEVDTEEAVDEILDERRRRFQQRDARVTIVDKEIVRTRSADGAFEYETINCYVGYLLPTVVEVQHFRSRSDVDPSPRRS